MNTKTLAILSGGMDSTVLAHSLAEQGTLAGCVSVNYGQRHLRELTCAQFTANKLGVPFYLVDLSSLGGLLARGVLTQGGHVPEGHYAAETMKATVVPNRNMVLIAVAASVALSHKCSRIAYGAHAGDHAIYPDCRPEFAVAMNHALSLCDYEEMSLVRPFLSMTKADIVALGVSLDVDFGMTHTCYNGKVEACGKCGTCVERLEAFDIAGFPDPLSYADRTFWKEAIKNVTSTPKQTSLL